MRAAHKITATAIVLPVGLWVAFMTFGYTYCPMPNEPQRNLRSAGLNAMSVYHRHQRYEGRVGELKFASYGGNRYAYYFASAGPLAYRSGGEALPCPDCVGVQVDSHRHPTAALHATYAATGCPLTTAAVPPFESMPDLGVRNRPGAEAWLFAAAGNLDDYPSLDCWSIASYDRLDSRGRVIPALDVYQEQAPGVLAMLLRLVL